MIAQEQVQKCAGQGYAGISQRVPHDSLPVTEALGLRLCSGGPHAIRAGLQIRVVPADPGAGDKTNLDQILLHDYAYPGPEFRRHRQYCPYSARGGIRGSTTP